MLAHIKNISYLPHDAWAGAWGCGIHMSWISGGGPDRSIYAPKTYYV